MAEKASPDTTTAENNSPQTEEKAPKKAESPKTAQPQLTIENILKASENLRNIVRHTPLEYNIGFSEKYDANIFFKREDLQVIRSYKIRGAYNFLSTTPKEKLQKGIVCASAGNHAQGVALSCKLLDIKGKIFMPGTTPKQKLRKVESFGGDNIESILVGDTFDEAYQAAKADCEKHGLLFVHPFDDVKVMEGSGTIGVEMFNDSQQKLDYILLPIGGGGLASGVSTFFKKVSPGTKIIGVEPAGGASMALAFEKGKPTQLEHLNKFVDGASVGKVGDQTYAICKDTIDELVAVPEGKICSTIIELYNEEAIVVEPAGALAVAALDFLKDQIKGKNVAIAVCGSNNDLDRLQEIKERSMIYEGLQHYFLVDFPQRPGALRLWLDKVLGPTDDINWFEFKKKNNRETGTALVGIEVQEPNNCQLILQRMDQEGINYKVINEDPSLFYLLT